MPTAYHAMMQPSAYAASWLRSGHGQHGQPPPGPDHSPSKAHTARRRGERSGTGSRWLARAAARLDWIPAKKTRGPFSTAPNATRAFPSRNQSSRGRPTLPPLPTLCANERVRKSNQARSHQQPTERMEAAAATALPFAAAVPTAWRVRASPRTRRRSVAAKLERGLGKGVPTTNYVVPLDKATGMTRPLVEILRDLNKRVPDKIIDPDTNTVNW
jgi:hypothetical protein